MRALLALALWLTACGDATPQSLPATGAAQSAGAGAAVIQRGAPGAHPDDVTASRHSAIVEAAARVGAAVVSVNVVRRERRMAQSAWDFFFIPRGYERLVEGLGSGFILSPDGVVVTNQHVTAGAEQIVVTSRDGTDYEAKLLGEDPLTDIAVLKIEGKNLSTAPIGRTDDLQIGEWVVAIGNPYGYLLGNTEPSVTAGVVSAVGRNLLPSGDDAGVYVGMIQTDAAINPGNSGGPLANALGEVIGVNSSILSESGGSVGIGFAIPIERAIRVANELQRYGTVRRAWTGLSVAGQDQLRAWKRSGGLGVTAVVPDGPAAEAGIRPGDILVTAGNHPQHTFLDWEAARLDVSPGDPLTIVLRRDGRERTVRLIVRDLPSAQAEKLTVLGDLRLVTLTPAIRQERGIDRERGALTYEIGEETQRATGLQPGDLIFQINRLPIATADDVRDAFRRAAGGGGVRIYFERAGAIGVSDFRIR